MEICYEATTTNPNNMYTSNKNMLGGSTQYELTAYIDSGRSVCFGKSSLLSEFVWKKVKKKPLKVRIADNNIISHNKAIQALNIEIGGVQCVILVL